MLRRADTFPSPPDLIHHCRNQTIIVTLAHQATATLVVVEPGVENCSCDSFASCFNPSPSLRESVMFDQVNVLHHKLRKVEGTLPQDQQTNSIMNANANPDGQGQSQVQCRLAAGLPAPTIDSKVARAGESIKAVDKTMGKTVQEAGENLIGITSGLDVACRDMFRDLDQIAKD